MYFDLKSLVISLMRLIIKSNVISEAKPLTSVVVGSASIFDPSIILDYSCENLKKLLHHLMGLKILSAQRCNKISQEFLPFHKNIKASKDRFANFSKSDDSLDSFYYSVFPNLDTSYPKLPFLLKLIFILSHGQASVERGFGLRNFTPKDNISELSIDSKRVIIDHMLSNGFKPESIPIDTPLMLAFKSARSKYEKSKMVARASKECSEQEKQRKQLGTKIKEVNLKIDNIRKTVTYLDDEFTSSVFKAESEIAEEQTKLIAKAAALKRKSNLKKEEIKELEEQLKVLE